MIILIRNKAYIFMQQSDQDIKDKSVARQI